MPQEDRKEKGARPEAGDMAKSGAAPDLTHPSCKQVPK